MLFHVHPFPTVRYGFVTSSSQRGGTGSISIRVDARARRTTIPHHVVSARGKPAARPLLRPGAAKPNAAGYQLIQKIH
ncbi:MULTISPECIES: hypothetical protein [Burkholderia]|uniref:Uncharacterized protein n=1 Tax=Burkholderia anthina TaxID=179879 RepID=A0A7T6VMW6_9BURK|nr:MULTISPECIES: hypothetical protein [Burkholderia]MBY4866841.1 hypothetical protein [Burkholderia anthina]QQK06861.1 hypothetical protein JFN94_18920 [Burkholderia anthina]